MYSDRKEFLKKAGSVALFAALGIQYTACSSSTGPETNNDDDGNGENPITIEGNKVTLDISSSFFDDLQNQVEWLSQFRVVF